MALRQPSSGNFVIARKSRCIGIRFDDPVKVVTHHRVSIHGHRKDAREFDDSILYPFLPLLEPSSKNGEGGPERDCYAKGGCPELLLSEGR